jgi:S-adenosylmethionine-diacylglycerol 3-amino-3-carboxypropyl transferase
MQRDATAETAIGETVKGGRLIEGAAVSTTGFGPGALLEKAFALVFRGLVYPQIWEDPVCDMEGLAIGENDHIVAIASGGCNALSYLTAGPAKITAIDLNAAHVALNRLKHAALLHLPDYAHFRRFFADADCPGNVAAYFRHVAPQLDPRSRNYWESRDLLGRRRIGMFAKGFYRYGLLGTFIGFAHLLARLHGVNPRHVLEAQGVDEQRALFEADYAHIFDKPLIRLLTGHKASLFGLGIPPVQYDKLAGGRSMAEVLRERLEKLTCDFDFRDNYFAWQAFSRGYAKAPQASLPPYLQEAHYHALRERIGRIEVLQHNLTDWLARKEAQSIDKYLLLDAQDWMTDGQLNQLWGQICRTAAPGARVLFRTADGPSLLPGRLANGLLEMWRYDVKASRRLTARDRSSIYGGVHLYVRRD